MTTTLNFPIDNFDQDNTFTFEYAGIRGTARTATGYLFQDGEQIFLMKQSACIKAEYTAKDREESDRLRAMTPVRTGDIVEVRGQQYRVKILGNYSDAGRLIPV